MNRLFVIFLATLTSLFLSACDRPPSSDEIQRIQQESILKEGTAQIGMPRIANFREKKLLKDILEKRDQEGLVTYTYFFSDMKGCLVPAGDTIGYPIPYATQFTNPQKVEWNGHSYNVIPQADPNGLFSPANAEGTWVLMKDPRSNNTGAVYSEPKLIAMPFKAPDSSICKQ